MQVFQEKAKGYRQDVQSLKRVLRLQCEAQLQDNNVQHLLKTSTIDAKKHFTWDQENGKYALKTDANEQQAYDVLMHLDKSQSQDNHRAGRKANVNFPDPGALVSYDEPRPSSNDRPTMTGSAGEKARREMNEVDRNAKSVADAALL